MTGLRLRQIVSGGQTGVDRAALDVALELGIAVGGWCPKGRLAEDGPLERRYPLRETPEPDYAQRTEFNVRDSDATLIIAPRPLTGGTALTRQFVEQRRRPCLVVDPADVNAAAAIRRWLVEHEVAVLNIAGPRESTLPGAYDRATALLRRVLADLQWPHAPGNQGPHRPRTP